MGRQFLLNGLEQGSVQDRRLLPGQDLTPVFDLADEEPVPEEVGEGSSAKRDASAGLDLALDVALASVVVAVLVEIMGPPTGEPAREDFEGVIQRLFGLFSAGTDAFVSIASRTMR